MKPIFYITMSIMVLCSIANAQSTEKKSETKKKSRPPSGYMGLFDMNLSAGYQNNKEHHVYFPGPGSEDKNKNSIYVLGHFQESLLSNYFWATKQDQKVKFGFQETLDLGCSYGNEVTSGTAYPENKKQSGFGLIFAYEAGLAAVYKVNNTIDVGFTYYPFILSSFTPYNHYAKLRLRYSNFMGEFSAFGKTGIEFKYLKATKDNFNEHDRSTSIYYGISYFTNGEDHPYWSKSNNFLHLSIGLIL